MSVDAGFVEHLKDLFAGLGPIRAKRMFGAVGLSAGELFFAVADGDVVYLKTDASTQPAFAEAGSAPFRFVKEGAEVETSYWSLPDGAMEDPDEARRWGELALAAARRKTR